MVKPQESPYVVGSLTGFSINLLAFYHECCSLIGCSTHEQPNSVQLSTKWRLLLRIFKKRIWIIFGYCFEHLLDLY